MERAPFVCAGGPITAVHIPNDAPAEEVDLFPPEELETTDVFIPARPVAPGRPQVETPSDASFGARAGSGLRLQDPAAERARIAEALEQCAGNQTRAARLLGVSRRTLINHLERLNMPRPKKA